MADKMESQDSLGKEQFARLKPFCISLMKQRNEAGLASLLKQLSSLSGLSSSLVEYVLFPLRITLQESVR